ncbi:heterokaryon incompatibility protein-domain-containing protein [Cercophora newfieldiana]|uniref:Heterokaryon incompatibility protein-domain-containing protein n=1 Tax=Cercophora newfieldiana TaxID=92897 RepID=A0AA39Y1T8_9PEZI|nr:heterokaryon incompatibility protein-domain-containing protein [Cercophora newfieldiana]
MQAFDYCSVGFNDASKEIRILQLSPSPTWSSPLECRIFTAALGDPARPFKALSYVWGSDTTTYNMRITVDDPQTTNANNTTGDPQIYHLIPITTSLETALRYLRRPTDPTTLWIDQICINQSDIPEKNTQVALMGKIYAAASQVLVWLGPAAAGSDLVMDAWNHIGREAHSWGLESYCTQERNHLLLAMAYNSNPDANEETRKLRSLLVRAAEICAPLLRTGMMQAWFEREWFKRVWIVQEFSMCRDTVIVCGEKNIGVEPVKTAVLVLQLALGNAGFGSKEFAVLRPGVPVARLNEFMEEPTRRLFSVRARRQRFEKGERGAEGDKLHVILRKLFVGRETRATEYRDRIYGVLGLAVDAEELGIVPDYTPGLETTARILTGVARAMVEKGGQVDNILCYSQAPKTREAGPLPSWVPDWRGNLRKSYHTITEAVDTPLYAASGDSRVEVVPPPENNDKILGLRGYVVDTIERVAEGAWDDMNWDYVRYLRYLTQFDELYQLSLEKGVAIHGQDHNTIQRRKEEARWRVPIGDVYWSESGVSHRATPEIAIEHTRCVENVYVFQVMDRLDGVEFDERMAAWQKRFQDGLVGSNYRQSMTIMEGKRPFLTREDYLGMGPAEAEKGDVVVVFCGGRIPFVLRPKKREQSMFTLVGEAYCDGVMDGEIIEKGDKQTFFLE